MGNFPREPLDTTRHYPLKRCMRLIILVTAAIFILFSSISLFLYRKISNIPWGIGFVAAFITLTIKYTGVKKEYIVKI